jgi:hypothetical protein
MDRYALHEGVAAAYDIITATNGFVAETAPWALAKDPQAAGRLDAVLFEATEAVRVAATLLLPVMPTAAVRDPSPRRRDRAAGRPAPAAGRTVEKRRRAPAGAGPAAVAAHGYGQCSQGDTSERRFDESSRPGPVATPVRRHRPPPRRRRPARPPPQVARRALPRPMAESPSTTSCASS